MAEGLTTQSQTWCLRWLGDDTGISLIGSLMLTGVYRPLVVLWIIGMLMPFRGALMLLGLDSLRPGPEACVLQAVYQLSFVAEPPAVPTN